MFEDFRLKIFLTLTELRSFTATAQALGISQPAVSQNIAELERELGAALFLRGRAALSLTEQGLALKPYAEQILNAYAAARQSVEGNCSTCSFDLGDAGQAVVHSYGGDIHISIKKQQ